MRVKISMAVLGAVVMAATAQTAKALPPFDCTVTHVLERVAGPTGPTGAQGVTVICADGKSATVGMTVPAATASRFHSAALAAFLSGKLLWIDVGDSCNPATTSPPCVANAWNLHN
jgi:hypothetical protein